MPVALLLPQDVCAEPSSIAHELPAQPLCFTPSDWVGKYPSSVDEKSGLRLLDLPCIRLTLKKMMEPSDLKLLMNGLSAEKPVQIINQYLIVAKCEAHNCPSRHAIIIIDTENKNYFVALYRRSENASVTKWYASDQDVFYLPQEIAQYFLFMHEPR